MDGNPENTLAYLMGRCDKYVKQQARDTIIGNVKNDKRRARYARIPCKKACKFCVMLGSRGFVYHTESTAGGNGNAFHPDCNCQIAVAFDVSYSMAHTPASRGNMYGEAQKTKNWDESKDASLEEYSPDELYDRYSEFADSFNVNSKSARRTVPIPEIQFDSLGDMETFINEAANIDELKTRCEAVEEWFNYDKSGKKSLNDKNWNMLVSTVQSRKRDLAA